MQLYIVGPLFSSQETHHSFDILKGKLMNSPVFAALIAVVATYSIAAPIQAATLSWSASAPTVDGADIANFTGSSTDAGNVQGGDDGATYVAHDRPALGQTFTTGSNALGYDLNAISLQHVLYDPLDPPDPPGPSFWSVDGGWAGSTNDGRFDLQVGTIT
ncbi:MAG: hypothetical protein MI757_06210, partial [Pirellulales bacterium]|nr:hypothetical protein [Pirellulales bacterium]